MNDKELIERAEALFKLNAKRTQGDWIVRCDNADKVTSVESLQENKYGNKPIICCNTHYYPTGVMVDDQAFIAAAPEMIRLIQDLLTAYKALRMVNKLESENQKRALDLIKPFPPMREDESTVVTGVEARRINKHCKEMWDTIDEMRKEIFSLQAAYTPRPDVEVVAIAIEKANLAHRKTEGLDKFCDTVRGRNFAMAQAAIDAIFKKENV